LGAHSRVVTHFLGRGGGGGGARAVHEGSM
jgi:hypothetical protein